MKKKIMEKIVSLARRRGFIFPACEIYGGLANAYSFGPYGTELKNNIKRLWWKMFVEDREDMVGIDGPIILHPKVWEASGHLENFNDALVDCRKCKNRFRADHLVEKETGRDMEGKLEAMSEVLEREKIKCPKCGAHDWTRVRDFNLMFKTEMNGIRGPVYLRGETAGAIFCDFKNILDSMRVKIPFGIAQIGKVFRNEIMARNFIFRLREFEQMEIEYFINPKADWEKVFDKWLKLQREFALRLGVKEKDLRHFEHPKAKLSHYSKKTVDIEYHFPFGFKELFGLAYRTDFDLAQHARVSGAELKYFDQESGQKFIPHVIEPTFGLERSVLAAILAAYSEEKVKGETRVVLSLPKDVAPVKAAILPLSKKPELINLAKEVLGDLKQSFVLEYDETQSIGKRYRRQDEIGTPYCVTIDFDSLKDKAVTVRDRDTMKQDRVKIQELKKYLREKLS
ncbi:MAG: glycine--tRNA ligase [Patescibacteria group bacterium]